MTLRLSAPPQETLNDSNGSALGHPAVVVPTTVCAPIRREEQLSPSLRDERGAPCYEMKFQIAEELAQQVEGWAREHLAFDSHANPALDNAYRIHTLYLDTAALNVYHRVPPLARRKLRLRRYDHEGIVFLERKTRRGDRVSKRRTPVAAVDLARLADPLPDPGWSGYWFHRRVLAQGVRPICHVTYDRVAHVGESAEGPLRLTLDRRIMCSPSREWRLAEAAAALPLLTSHVVLELKYRSALPTLFKQLIRDFQLQPRSTSKYRLSVEAWRLQQQVREVG